MGCRAIKTIVEPIKVSVETDEPPVLYYNDKPWAQGIERSPTKLTVPKMFLESPGLDKIQKELEVRVENLCEDDQQSLNIPAEDRGAINGLIIEGY